MLQNNVETLLGKLHEEINLVTGNNGVSETDSALNKTFVNALRKTVEEVKEGSDSDDFKDLVIVNFMLDAIREKYSTEVIVAFVTELENVKEF